jgi:hypothetical protein
VTDYTDNTKSVSISLVGDLSASTWTVTSDGHGGANIVDPPAAHATIAPGGTLEVNVPSSDTLTFAGATGSLVLDQPAGFTGHIFGFNGTAPERGSF